MALDTRGSDPYLVQCQKFLKLKETITIDCDRVEKISVHDGRTNVVRSACPSDVNEDKVDVLDKESDVKKAPGTISLLEVNWCIGCEYEKNCYIPKIPLIPHGFKLFQKLVEKSTLNCVDNFHIHSKENANLVHPEVNFLGKSLPSSKN